MTLIRTFDYDLPLYIDKMLGRDSGEIMNSGSQVGYNIPAVNVLENNESFLLEVAVPGYQKEDFQIEVVNHALVLSGKKQNKENEKQRKHTLKEFNYTSWKRTFALPKTIETEGIQAKYENGILNVLVPKREEAKVKPPKSIEIK